MNRKSVNCPPKLNVDNTCPQSIGVTISIRLTNPGCGTQFGRGLAAIETDVTYLILRPGRGSLSNALLPISRPFKRSADVKTRKIITLSASCTPRIPTELDSVLTAPTVEATSTPVELEGVASFSAAEKSRNREAIFCQPGLLLEDLQGGRLQ